MSSSATRLLLLPALFALALLAGCATLAHDPALVKGQSTAQDVQARYGQPVRSWSNPDGGQTLEYSSQPFGQTCYLVTLDRAGRLLNVEDTLTEASRFAIETGMTQLQVSRRLGLERSRMFFKLSGEDVWDWNVRPDQGGYLLRFNVHFKNGVVARLSQSMVVPGKFPFGDD